jgi:hypothetical protein
MEAARLQRAAAVVDAKVAARGGGRPGAAPTRRARNKLPTIFIDAKVAINKPITHAGTSFILIYCSYTTKKGGDPQEQVFAFVEGEDYENVWAKQKNVSWMIIPSGFDTTPAVAAKIAWTALLAGRKTPSKPFPRKNSPDHAVGVVPLDDGEVYLVFDRNSGQQVVRTRPKAGSTQARANSKKPMKKKAKTKKTQESISIHIYSLPVAPFFEYQFKISAEDRVPTRVKSSTLRAHIEKEIQAMKKKKMMKAAGWDRSKLVMLQLADIIFSTVKTSVSSAKHNNGCPPHYTVVTSRGQFHIDFFHVPGADFQWSISRISAGSAYGFTDDDPVRSAVSSMKSLVKELGISY